MNGGAVGWVQRAIAFGACGLLGAWSLPRASQPLPGARAATLDPVRVLYLQRCGGCHGIQGRSAPARVPTLRGQVGYFLCTDAGRAYLIRLPSVATAPVSDQRLADLMNFVIFDVGRTDRGAYAPYSASEVGRLRASPLNEIPLARYRAQLVDTLIRDCGAPAALRDYSVGDEVRGP